MLVAYGAAVAVAAALGVYWFLKRHKPLAHVLKELRSDVRMQCVGFAGLLDDRLQGWRNRVPPAPGGGGARRVAVVTGGARGIGEQVARGLLAAGYVVVLGLRSPRDAERLRRQLPRPADLLAFPLDLRSRRSVRAFAASVTAACPELHLLVNNAGIMFGERALTEDGVEAQFAVNYLSHFYLTHLLLPALRAGGAAAAAAARVVHVTSCGHYPAAIDFDDINMERHYDTTDAYARSKLAQVMCARHTSRLLERAGEPVRCYSVHPGVVDTDLFRETAFRRHFSWAMRLAFKTAEQGAIPVLYACFAPELAERGGLYISNCREGYSNSFSKNEAHQARLHRLSCELVGVRPDLFGKQDPATTD